MKKLAWITPLVLAGFASTAMAEDALVAFRAGEARLGPLAVGQETSGLPVNTRISAFARLEHLPDRKLLHARLVIDLSDVQAKAGTLLDAIPLPSDNCARFGDNLIPRIWGKTLSVNGDVAALDLNGDVDVWGCAKNPLLCSRWEWGWPPRLITWECNDPIKARIIRQPFDARLPFRLTLLDSRTIAIQFDEPQIELGGSLGSVTQAFVDLIGVDVSAFARKALEPALYGDLLRLSIPPEILQNEFRFTGASFVESDGRLAAQVELEFTIPADVAATIEPVMQHLVAHQL